MESRSAHFGAVGAVAGAAVGTAAVIHVIDTTHTKQVSGTLQGSALSALKQNTSHGAIHDLHIYAYERWLPVLGWRASNLHFYERAALATEHGEGAYTR